MQVSFKQSPQAARATTKSSDVTRMIYASRAVPMAARNAVVGLIEVADGRSRSALYSGLNRRLERVKSTGARRMAHAHAHAAHQGHKVKERMRDLADRCKR